MKCPVCSNVLSQITAKDVTVDVCDGGCGGIWFDNFELKRFDEPHDTAGEALLKVHVNETLHIDYTQKRNCPRCADVLMMRHYFSAQRRVEVDECPNCGGYWLDAGELALIRKELGHDKERKQATDQILSAMSKHPSLRRDHAERARTIDSLFRLVGSRYAA